MRKRETVDRSWHLDIGYDFPNVAATMHHAQCMVRATSFDHLKTTAGQVGDKHGTYLVFIINNQNDLFASRWR
ncbi:hypothetical protein EBBID32_13310 [Sphingobium indicum BiD32]|uniref:Uncharacterized protein n=1 Tax=Sphingobium indicum BiD32 TaxID=1301087 RepID=N1MN09_9SPHN|nr:hypothetical protein EBBID32_13310 [Sphingobium indicum BiD32]